MYNKMIYIEQQSKAIDFLRFPLILCVVISHICAHIIHTDNIDWTHTWIYHCFKTGSDLGGLIGVSVFFFISGYLFFYNVSFDKETYKKKIRKRIHSLVIPYVFWNALVTLFYLIIESNSTINTFMVNRDFISDNNWGEYLLLFWNPVANQFWFIKDLFLMCLFSPVLYYLLRKWGRYFIIGLGIVWCMVAVDYELPVFKLRTLFFFAWGAWLSMSKMNIIVMVKKFRVISYIFPLLLFVYFITLTKWGGYSQIITICAIPFSFCITNFFSQTMEINKSFLASSSFFVFAAFEPFLLCLKKVVFYLIQPQNDICILWLSVIILIFIIIVLLTVYRLLQLYIPSFLHIITGNR